MREPASTNLSQFNLRTLFAAIALAAAVFAAARYGGWPGLLAAATLAALMCAHIFGNALGTRLRDEVSPEWNRDPPNTGPRLVLVRRPAVERRLHERTPLGPMIFVTTGGAAAGAQPRTPPRGDV